MKKIKKLLLISVVCLTFGCSYKTTEKPILNSSLDLVGVWDYVETRDYKGEKIESFKHNSLGKIKSSGPQIILNQNSSYKKVFDSLNIDSGFWSLDKEKLIIEYDLFIDSTDWIGKDLIKSGLAIKQSDGLYYERIEDRILEFGEGLMVIDLRGNQQVYKKREY